MLSSAALLMSFLAVLAGALIGLLWVIAATLVIVFCFVGGAGSWFDTQSCAAVRASQQRDKPPSTHQSR